MQGRESIEIPRKQIGDLEVVKIISKEWYYIYQFDDYVEQTKLEYCKDLFYKIEGWRLIFQPKIPSLLGLPFYDDRSFYYIHTYNPNAMAALEFIVVAPHPQHFLAMAFRR